MRTQQTSKLLVVDDEEANRDLLSRRLKRAGFAVELASSAHEALEVIEREKIDLVLLDYMMPEMNGIDLLRLLRATQSQSDLPVIMVTAVNDSVRVVEALSIGANDYVTKPIDFPVALARVESQLLRRDADRMLRASEERLSMAANSNQAGIFDWNLNTGEFFASKEWQEISGLTEWEGSNCEFWLSRLHPRDEEWLRAAVNNWKCGESEDRLEWESRLRQADGSYRVLQMRATVKRNKSGNSERLVGSILDITKTKNWNDAIGLGNRRLLVEKLEEAKCGQVLMVLALDRFKLVSDSMGAAAGQKVVLEMAGRIATVLGDSITLVSSEPALLTCIDGDQFGILLGVEAEGARAEQTAARLIAAIEAPLEIEGRKLFSSANAGLVRLGENQHNPEEILLMATTALGQAKLEGRGQTKTFEEDMRGRAIERLELENDLRVALERDQFVVFYQAKVDLKKGTICGFEALLRWRHPEKGLVPPDKFIPIAEESGIMIPLGTWVLREASKTMQRWRKEFPAREEMEISVNVSAYQMKDGSLARRVKEVLQETGLEPKALQLEITESVFIADTKETAQIFGELKEMGVKLHLDDFGTGYSSLQYLSNMKFDALKIDKVFLKEMCSNEQANDLVKSMLGIAQNLDMEVVAEGIETKEQQDHLRRLGCSYGQGYLFSKPVPEAEALALLRKDMAQS